MVAAKIAPFEHGGKRKNQAANLLLDLVMLSEFADILNVSERSVRTAKKVVDEGAYALVEKVERSIPKKEHRPLVLVPIRSEN